MITGICKLEIILFEVHSLKEKRMIIKSIIGRLQSKFNIAVSEVGYQDQWGRSEIGISCVSTQTKHANQMLDKIIDFVDKDGRVEITRKETEYIKV